MENINLAVVTDDRAYGEALAHGLISVCRTMIVNLFTPDGFMAPEAHEDLAPSSGMAPEAHDDLAPSSGMAPGAGLKPGSDLAPNSELPGFDLVLWDGTPRISGPEIVRLVDKPSLACRGVRSDGYRIYKYSPAGRIVSEIFDIYGKVTGRQPVNVSPAGVHVYAFCAAAGGTGCSTVAMAVCQEMKRFHGSRVVYISLEELESTGGFMRSAAGAENMTHYLYDLFKDRRPGSCMVAEEKAPYRPFMESFMISDDFGVEAFRPTKGRNPLIDLSSEEICVFVESVMSCGKYDALVIDAGTGLSPAAVTCLEMAERVCLVSAEDADLLRETSYLQYLMAICGEDIIRKMIKIENMVRSRKYHDFFAGDLGESGGGIIDTDMIIERDNIYTEEGSMKKVLLEGNFGNQISKLANKFIEPLP